MIKIIKKRENKKVLKNREEIFNLNNRKKKILIVHKKIS